MDFESKIISREISQLLWEREKTVSTAESCTGGRIAEAIIAVPGASKYFKGGIICYVNEVKEGLLGVSHETLEEKTAVCEEVAIQMVEGACRTLRTDYAVAATGVAGPGGGTKEIPVGTIWLACGNKDRVVTCKVEEDHGRDINLAIATSKAMQMFLDYLKNEEVEETDSVK
jgi:nicotinamide-nucleotide amidase